MKHHTDAISLTYLYTEMTFAHFLWQKRKIMTNTVTLVWWRSPPLCFPILSVSVKCLQNTWEHLISLPCECLREVGWAHRSTISGQHGVPGWYSILAKLLLFIFLLAHDDIAKLCERKRLTRETLGGEIIFHTFRLEWIYCIHRDLCANWWFRLRSGSGPFLNCHQETGQSASCVRCHILSDLNVFDQISNQKKKKKKKRVLFPFLCFSGCPLCTLWSFLICHSHTAVHC